MNNILIDFLRELFMRLFKKSPKFFNVISAISLGAALVTGLPGLFKELNVTLPEWAEFLQNRLIAIASTTAFIISKLTTQSTAVGVTSSGEVLKKTDESKLPFTARVEEKQAKKEGGVLNPKTDTSDEIVTIKKE